MIVRSDTPLGVQVAQTIHAAGESVGGPVPPTTHAVALHATLDQLLDLERRLIEGGVAFSAIREPDPPWDGALMAIGITPTRKDLVRQYVRHLGLVR